MDRDKILNFFFPARCPFCREVTQLGRICPHCKDRMERYRIPPHLMQINHNTLKKVDRCISFYYYDDIVRQGVINAKIKSCKSFVSAFGEYAAFDFREYFEQNNIDTVVSMPAHRSKFYNKEFDLPQHIAKTVAQLGGVEYNNSLVTKVRRTKNQHNLNSRQRKSNLKNAFRADEAAKGKNIVIVDDIITSGNSLEAVAKALKQSGANTVMAVTFAYNNKI